ncbi:MAG: TolC family protein [Acidobacteriota bacterium]|nr:TolC family protein [Acidobacteriota bacterium]
MRIFQTASRYRKRSGFVAFALAFVSSAAPAIWAQTQTAPPPPQNPPPATTTSPAPQQQPAPPVSRVGRQAGVSDAGRAATTALPAIQLTSSQFVDPSGLTIERLGETGFSRRADLLAARQRLAIAEGRVIQSGLRPNPTVDTEYGSPRFLAGESEFDFSAGVSQVFELGGKRRKRVAVAQLGLEQARTEVIALERQFAAELRAAYVQALGFARQLDVLEQLIAANEELVRVTDERLKEGDVAPLDFNLVRVETDRLRVQVVRTRADLESQLITLRTLVGFEQVEPLRIAPLPERPPRLDLSLLELTEIALRERADLRAARLGEELGTARITLAESLATPNVAASVRYSRNRGIFDLPERLGSGILSDTANELTFGVSIELPVFNRNQGEIASAVGERTQATRQREFLETTIRRDVALAYRRYRAAAETLVLYSTQIVPRSEQNLNTVRTGYNLGEFSVFDIVNEQRRLIENQTGYIESLRDYYTTLAEIERALGTPIPATSFAPGTVSVIPDSRQFKSRDFLRAVAQPSQRSGQTPITRSGQQTAPAAASFLRATPPTAPQPVVQPTIKQN